MTTLHTAHLCARLLHGLVRVFALRHCCSPEGGHAGRRWRCRHQAHSQPPVREALQPAQDGELRQSLLALIHCGIPQVLLANAPLVGPKVQQQLIPGYRAAKCFLQQSGLIVSRPIMLRSPCTPGKTSQTSP